MTVARAGLARLDEGAADPLHVAGLHTHLAIALASRGDHGASADAAARALAAFERGLAPDHPQLIAARANLGTSQRLAGRLAEALASHRAAFDAAAVQLAPEHPRRLNVTVELALSLLATGDAAAAHPLLTRAVAALSEQDRPSALAEARFALARSTLATGGSRARAVALARQAEAVYAASPGGAAQRDEIAAWLRGNAR